MKTKNTFFSVTIALFLLCASHAYGVVTTISSSKADFEFTWTPSSETPPGWFQDDAALGDNVYGNLENKQDKLHQKLIYMIARYLVVPGVSNLPKIGADILIPDGQGDIIDGGPAKENFEASFNVTLSHIVVEQSWLLSECPESERIALGSLHLSFRDENGGLPGGNLPELQSITVRTRCLVPDSGSTAGLVALGFLALAFLRKLKSDS